MASPWNDAQEIDFVANQNDFGNDDIRIRYTGACVYFHRFSFELSICTMHIEIDAIITKNQFKFTKNNFPENETNLPTL